jgi:sugar phosphate isomerase/epimerase
MVESRQVSEPHLKITRRNFVTTLAVAGLTARFLHAEGVRLPLAFSTLGCPKWTWPQILEFAAANGYAAVELRGILGELDLPSRPEFAPDKISGVKRDLAAHGLKISDLGSSSELHHADEAERAKSIADCKRFIDLAEKLEAPYVRVFGNKLEGPRDEVVHRVAKGLRELALYASPRNVTVVIESHGDFVTSPLLKQVLTEADHPNALLLWDAHHTFVDGNEEPEFTVGELRKWIRHTHLKDSVPLNGDRHYVLTGKGDVPIQRQVQALLGIGYKGYYCFEWEKLWHPDIAEPEVAIADFSRVVSGYLQKSRS